MSANQGRGASTLLFPDSGAHENARDKRALPMHRCRRMPADTAPVRALRFGRSDRAAGLALTIQIVANQQPDALRKQQRGVLAPFGLRIIRAMQPSAARGKTAESVA